MPITIDTPISKPAEVFPYFAIRELAIKWTNLNEPVTATIKCEIYRTDENGINIGSGVIKEINIADLFAAAQQNNNVNVALQAVLGACYELYKQSMIPTTINIVQENNNG